MTPHIDVNQKSRYTVEYVGSNGLLQMNSKNKKTLLAFFEKPVRKNILWSDVESLFSALGADVVNRGGSVVTIVMNGKPHTFHRPHPEKEAKAYCIKLVRKFLEENKVKP